MTDAQCRDWGESSLLPLYNPPSPSYYNLLHRTSLLELMHASLLLVLLCLSFCLPLNINSPSPLDHLIIYILWTSTTPHPQWPPIKLAQSPTLLFGSSNPSSPSPHCFLSCPVNGLWSGNTACFSGTNLLWAWSTWDHILTFTTFSRWLKHIIWSHWEETNGWLIF